MNQPRIRSRFALLDVLGEAETAKLEDRLANDEEIKVTITGVLQRRSSYSGSQVAFKAWSQFDGVSQEFAVDVDSVEVVS